MKSARVEIIRLFDLVGNKFVPDEKSMGQFIETFLDEDEIRDKLILDAGCGTGVATIYFGRKQARKALGIDISYNSLQRGMELRNKYGLMNVHYQLGDLTKLPFRDNSLDLVCSLGVFPYIRERKKAGDEFRRILKGGGTLLIMLLRKQKMDTLYELVRRILSRVPWRCRLLLARLLAFLIRPVSKILLGRNISPGEKPISQTVLESFFSPQRLFKDSPEELKRMLEQEGFMMKELICPALSFCSPKTVFVLKGKLIKDYQGIK